VYDYTVAFSRDNPDRKTYVQHKILERGREIHDRILSKRAPIYICGDGWSMARDVEAALVQIALEYGSAKTKEEAEKLIKSVLFGSPPLVQRQISLGGLKHMRFAHFADRIV
jgi:NADPH-ferrihemoprotein reductase